MEKGIVIKSKTSIGSASELKDAIAYLVRRHSPPQIVFWIVTRSELLGHSLVLHLEKKKQTKKKQTQTHVLNEKIKEKGTSME